MSDRNIGSALGAVVVENTLSVTNFADNCDLESDVEIQRYSVALRSFLARRENRQARSRNKEEKAEEEGPHTTGHVMNDSVGTTATTTMTRANLDVNSSNTRDELTAAAARDPSLMDQPRQTEDSLLPRPQPIVRRVSTIPEPEPQSHVIFRQNVRRRRNLLHQHPSKGAVEGPSSTTTALDSNTAQPLLSLASSNNNRSSDKETPAAPTMLHSKPTHNSSSRDEFSAIVPPAIPTTAAVAIGRRRRMESLQDFIRVVRGEILRCSREGEREKMRILYHSPAQSRPTKRRKQGENDTAADATSEGAPNNLQDITVKMQQVDSHVQRCCAEARQIVRDAQEELTDLQILDSHPAMLAAAPCFRKDDNNENNNNNVMMLLNLEDDVADSYLPKEVRCPITHELMTDPVMAADGHTYERSSMQNWMSRFTKRKKPTSPATNLPLASRVLVSNHNVRSLCRTYEEVLVARKRKREADTVG